MKTLLTLFLATISTLTACKPSINRVQNLATFHIMLEKNIDRIEITDDCSNFNDCAFLNKELTPSTIDNLQKLGGNDLRILRNTIYAKYGQKFKALDLQKIFTEYSWYKPKTNNVDKWLSKVEKENIIILKKLENRATARDLKRLLSMFPLYCHESACLCICENGMITESDSGESYLGLILNTNKTVDGLSLIEHDNFVMAYSGYWDTAGDFLKLNFTETVKKDDPYADFDDLKVIETRKYNCKVKVGTIEQEPAGNYLVEFYGHGNQYRCRERLSKP